MTATEIALLMAQLLDVDEVMVDDNFFELGGNSLLALQLIARLEDNCGTDISLLDVVRGPTPAQLASLAVGETTTAIGP